MVRVENDAAGKRVTLRFSGHVTPADADACARQLTAALAGCQPGFKLLTDLSQLEAMDADCAASIERMMDLCNDQGVAQVVRVIPDPHKDIGLNIMSLFHYHRRMPITTCVTIEEALKFMTD